MMSFTTIFSILGLLLLAAAECTAFNVLVIGGTRFSGAYLWKELYDRGHDVTVYNRGKTSPKPVARESDDAFQARIAAATSLQGDRTSLEDLQRLINPSKYDYVFDMNAREVSDTKPLAELFVGQSNFKQYVFMSSAGVYLKSDEMPHLERDPVDPQSRHKGKLDSENCLRELGLPWCSFRPTYICGPLNYNPVERYFFERVDADRPICIPGHGQHLTGKRKEIMFLLKSRQLADCDDADVFRPPSLSRTWTRGGSRRSHGQLYRTRGQDQRQSVQLSKYTGHYL
jgi:nucleoside-diphosphate-sugar epimerase